MKRNDLPTYKTVEYAEEGFFIQIPRYYNDDEEKELFVKEKPLVKFPEKILYEVINFKVYYLDGDTEVVPPSFDPPIRLRVCYDRIDDTRELYIYDDRPEIIDAFSIGRGNLTKIPLPYHGRPGSVYLELHKVPPDPNVGWG